MTKLNSKALICITIVTSIAGCASPRVWVLRQDSYSGVVAYQNYDPKNDNGNRIRKLIPCENFRMVANPIYRQNVTPSTYGYSSFGNSGYVYPIDGGFIETAEFHYECISSSFSTNSTDRGQNFNSETNSSTKELVKTFSKCLFLSYCQKNSSETELESCLERMCK